MLIPPQYSEVSYSLNYAYLVLSCDFVWLCLIPMVEMIICIPVTKSVIEILRTNMLSPEIGTITARADTAMFRIPTPIRMAFDHFGISLDRKSVV